ncbi:hypothetical protein HBI18_057300 [Parastagonospora nodorum]|nr:hypothetical protein HBI00_123450 [Parastagonospora nodorum]KAH4929386.1 hypothetical protein HBI79_119840 [Parastagonospora nodorum]KAH5056483.1 hypothetical protein HBH96_118210 [Parastagonospora nodorum]KAH5078861.1 hypothetical protein HBH95_096390 [Parastagonospora nodorum]KAH5431041.1 hypothetical protein HBI47_106880 [Parastagonospora nodorum]
MAQSSTMEDYYMILGVEQTAALRLIISSYRRLALELHPDRNPKHDATEAFQRTLKLGRAYETLKDESKRRAYNLIYPSIIRRRSFPRNTQTPHQPPTSASRSETLCEAAQIVAIQKSKQERSARWHIKSNSFGSSIFELQRLIRRLEQEIKNLDTILAAEAAVEAQKNSWGAWLLSPIYKKAEDSEEEKERKDRARQERRIEKDMKKRRLDSNKADLKTQEILLRTAKEEVDAAIRSDDEKIRVIQARIRAREDHERREREKRERERREKEMQERERQERERTAKIWKQQQEQWLKREQEAKEASRKQQEKRAGEALARLIHQLVTTTAGGLKYKVVQHVRGAMKVGLTCCNALAV